jgi:hypothetical protein
VRVEASIRDIGAAFGWLADLSSQMHSRLSVQSAWVYDKSCHDCTNKTYFGFGVSDIQFSGISTYLDEQT